MTAGGLSDDLRTVRLFINGLQGNLPDRIQSARWSFETKKKDAFNDFEAFS
jgi:hypothetical protein